MLRLCSAAKRWSTRPSELLGIEDSYTAFCLDEAGALLLSLMETSDEKQRKMIKWSDTLTDDGKVKGSDNEAALQGFLEQIGGVVG